MIEPSALAFEWPAAGGLVAIAGALVKFRGLVYWNRFDAPAATVDGETDELDSVGRTVWTDPVSEPGSYSVYADADITSEANSNNWETTDLPASSNTACMGVDIILSRDEQLRLQTYS